MSWHCSATNRGYYWLAETCLKRIRVANSHCTASLKSEKEAGNDQYLVAKPEIIAECTGNTERYLPSKADKSNWLWLWPFKPVETGTSSAFPISMLTFQQRFKETFWGTFWNTRQIGSKLDCRQIPNWNNGRVWDRCSMQLKNGCQDAKCWMQKFAQNSEGWLKISNGSRIMNHSRRV